MTEMKARLVDKDGNPLGTAANPLKISDHSISTATWGSITGTLSDQTDLNTTLIAKASSTPAALSILVYDGTPSAGDLTTYDEIYTTPALCFAALPAIINHAVTITMRKADGSAYAAATLQRVVAGGSITIQGEYYYNNTVASAGSGTGKFNVISGHSGLVQTGDKVLMIKYSGTVGASTPSDAFVDTVAGVSGTEITLTTRTTDAFDTTWRYVIVRTVCAGISTLNTPRVIITGLYYAITSTPLDYTNSTITASSTIIDASSSSLARVITAKGSDCPSDNVWQYVGVIFGNSAGTSAGMEIRGDCTLVFRNVAIFSTRGASAYPTINCNILSSGNFTYIYARNGATPLFSASGIAVISQANIDGNSSDDKITTALLANNGGKILGSSWTFGSNITTQKNPANWAATTDGSYIS